MKKAITPCVESDSFISSIILPFPITGGRILSNTTLSTTHHDLNGFRISGSESVLFIKYTKINVKIFLLKNNEEEAANILINRLKATNKWGIFSEKAGKFEELIKGGQTIVLDLSAYGQKEGDIDTQRTETAEGDTRDGGRADDRSGNGTDAWTVETRQAEPIDRTIGADQSGREPVSNQPVIGNGESPGRIFVREDERPIEPLGSAVQVHSPWRIADRALDNAHARATRCGGETRSGACH